MNRRILIGVIAVVVLGAIAIFALPKLTSKAGGDHVKIAINVPMTGPISAWSGQYANGFKMGIEEASGELKIDPAIFAVDAQDNAGKPDQAVSIFNRQRIDGFNAYISVATGPANAVAPQLDQMGTPHFIEAFDPFITRDGKSRFRMMANSKAEGPLLADYAVQRHAKTVKIIQINFAYANQEVSDIIQPELQKQGVTVSKELFELEQRDFNVIAQKARAEKPDVIIIIGYSFHIQALLRDLRAAGLVQPGRVVTSMDFIDLVDAHTPPAELQDVAFDAPLFEIPGKAPQAAAWRQRFKQKFNAEPTYVPAYAYDTAKLIVRAYAQAHHIDTKSLMAAQPFDGVSGPISLDSDRDIAVTGAIATLDPQGNIVPLTR